jgi:hypothetical protein
MKGRRNYRALGGCQAGLMKSDKCRFTIGGTAAVVVASTSFISIPNSGITNPWQELHIKKGEQGASDL